jgi:hypothetical protein
MIMPLSECPAAPAQGALALETLRNNPYCIELLQALHDPETDKLVQIEQRIMGEFAPHNATFGATAESDPVLGYVARLRGRENAHAKPVYQTRTAQTEVATTNSEKTQPWGNKSWQLAARKRPLTVNKFNAEAVFIAHADAYTAKIDTGRARCWTSGPRSWAQLAKRGVWVEGCADNLGFERVKPLLAAPVLRLPTLQNWLALTHADAVDGWATSGIGAVVPTYSIDINLDPVLVESDVAGCTHFYWASARQYRALKNFLPPRAHHACGAGKTFSALAAEEPDLRAFPSRREWQQWLA